MTFSREFNQIVTALKMVVREKGKPAPIRLYNLRKYFRNNLKMDIDYKEFLMGHKRGSDDSYISRDRELYRELYAKGYQSLRIYNPESIETSEAFQKLEEQLSQKDNEIAALTKKVDRLTGIMTNLVQSKDNEAFKEAYGYLENHTGNLEAIVLDLQKRLDKMEGRKTLEETIAEKDTLVKRKVALAKHRELKAQSEKAS